MVLKNTLTISLYSLLTFPIAIIFALLLNAFPMRRYKKVIQTTTYIPHFISTVVMVGLIFQLLNNRTGMFGSLYTFLQEAARLTCLRTVSILSTCMYGQGYGRGPATVP